MNRNTKRMTARQRRESSRKSHFLTHIIIAVVALVECLMLLAFATYSWIETSSSLIISTGSNYGMEYAMAVANNLSYQVLVSPDAGGAVRLAPKKDSSGHQEDAGFYREVQGFNFAMTSSPNGKDFYFKTNGGNTVYREGDTTDINTTYTYLDFEINNTTGYAKQFCFRDADNIFDYTGDSEYEDVILNAMRISFEVHGESDTENTIVSDSTPLIVSRSTQASPAQNYSPVNGVTGAVTSSPIVFDDSGAVYHSLEAHEYIEPTQQQPEPTQNPLFTSSADNASGKALDRVSVRIWIEEKDAGLVALQSDPDEWEDFLEALHAAEIKVNFNLVSDTIDYDAIYFDDYAFSNKVGCEGKFVTDEDDDYSMYLHAFNQKDNTFKNFKMTKTATNETPANRWIVSLPLGNVVQGDGNGRNYLTMDGSTPPTKWNDTYFYYGNEAGTEKLYQWDFSSLPSGQYLEIVDETDPDSPYKKKLTDNCSYFRNLGVVRDSTNFNSDEAAEGEPVVRGFLQYDRYNGTDSMQLTYLRDEATALTGEDYNVSSGGVLNYRYISAQAQKEYDIETVVQTEVPGTGGTVSFDYSALINKMTNGGGINALTQHDLEVLDRITYFDVPSGWNLIFRSSVDTNNHTSDNDQPRATAQTCYYVGNFSGGQIQYLQTAPNLGYQTSQNDPGLILNSTYLPASSSTDGWVRVYFYKSSQLDGDDQYKWGNYNVHRVCITVSSYNNNAAWIDQYGNPITEGTAPANGSEGLSLKDAIVNGNGVGTYTDKNGGSGGGYTTTIEPLYQRYFGGLYLNLRDGNDFEELARKTVSTYYDADAERFMAYVPQSWLTGGMDVHYNELSGYYDVSSDKLRWTTGSASMIDDAFTYNLLGYTDSHTVAQLNSGGNAVGTGIGTWDSVRRIEYTTELLYSNIGAGNVYKTGTSGNVYAMVPDASDDLYMKYYAYVPVTGLDAQSTNHNLRFNRYNVYYNNNSNGVWYPQDNITSKDTTYYALDSNAAIGSGDTAADRGWFHVAVFVDGTFEKIVYDTLYRTDAANNASLSYAEIAGASSTVYYTPAVSTSVSNNEATWTEAAGVRRIGNSRWVVRLNSSTNYVYFRWTPYPATNTSFDYTLDLSSGIYCVVTEAN